MAFLLNSHNVYNYLTEHGLCNQSESSGSKAELVTGKNFNLLVTFANNRKLLIKQERHNREGKAASEFLGEWRVQEFLQRFSSLDALRPWMPKILHFDAENCIIIFRYLDEYWDLLDFYTKENSFPVEITSAIGTILATLHRDTYNRQDYLDFFSQNSNHLTAKQIPKWIRDLERIEPEIFGLIPADGLRFFALYQRYDSLGIAIAQLGSAFTPACLTHNDLKLNNILLHTNWQQSANSIVRLIDWERAAWGDPAMDLGMVISSYVQIWLSSLVVSKSLSIEESLRLAMTPLELLHPSLCTLAQAYLNTFPSILEHCPDFLHRSVQFAGFALIQQIQAMIQYQKSFGNSGIVMLQVAKALLCRPEQSLSTIFGTATELAQLNASV